MFVLSKTGEGREQCTENEEENPVVVWITCRTGRNGRFRNRKRTIATWLAENRQVAGGFPTH